MRGVLTVVLTWYRMCKPDRWWKSACLPLWQWSGWGFLTQIVDLDNCCEGEVVRFHPWIHGWLSGSQGYVSKRHMIQIYCNYIYMYKFKETPNDERNPKNPKSAVRRELQMHGEPWACMEEASALIEELVVKGMESIDWLLAHNGMVSQCFK